MSNAQNCLIENAAFCELFSIWWRPISHCCILLRNIISEITWHVLQFDSSYVFSANSDHFGMEFAGGLLWILTNWTKVLRNRWCTRLQIGVGIVKGLEGTLILHINRLYFCLAKGISFENSHKSFTEYSTVTFGFESVHFYQPDIVNAPRQNFVVHAMTLRSDCWIDSLLLY